VNFLMVDGHCETIDAASLPGGKVKNGLATADSTIFIADDPTNAVKTWPYPRFRTDAP